MRTALVFVGGPHRRGHDGRVPPRGSPPLVHPGLVELDASGSEVVLGVAVDSGLHLAHAVDRWVDVVVGDMDSGGRPGGGGARAPRRTASASGSTRRSAQGRRERSCCPASATSPSTFRRRPC